MISIAEAKNRLPALIHQVEAGEAVTITRRGKPVAVMMSVEEYERVQGSAGSWTDRLDDWRAGLPDGIEGLTEAELDALRDREPYVPRVDFGTHAYADLDAAQALRVAEPDPAGRSGKPRGSKR